MIDSSLKRYYEIEFKKDAAIMRKEGIVLSDDLVRELLQLPQLPQKTNISTKIKKFLSGIFNAVVAERQRRADAMMGMYIHPTFRTNADNYK